VRSLTFLIADENDLQRRIAEQSLWKAGHQVMFAATAEEVEAALTDHDASVILISANLPTEEARAVQTAAQRTRRDPDTFALLPPPVLVIGAGAEEMPRARELLERGAAGIVARPYHADVLVRQLQLFSVGAFPATILAIDDSAVARKMATNVLQEEGHTLLQAGDGREGLAVLRNHPEVDMVLSDIVMPNLDGFGVCQAIRAQSTTADLPIVLLTSLDDIVSQSRAVEAGADEFLTKPISATELKMRVRTILRLKTLQRKLARRNEQLAQALEMRERLSRMLVHDFRNPLTRVLVSAELIADQCKEAGLEETAELTRDVLQGALRLTGLADDLLQVARLEDGVAKPETAPLALAETIGGVVDDMQRIASDRGVALRVDASDDLRVDADKKWIYRVLQNLLDNALKYSPKGSEIAVSTAVEQGAEPGHELVRVRVVDAGPGIPEEHRERIFEKFAQVPRSARRGTGLGLTFCRLAVEAHGGTIVVTERPDGAEGSAFSFTLRKA